jgi:hypothetical protein
MTEPKRGLTATETKRKAAIEELMEVNLATAAEKQEHKRLQRKEIYGKHNLTLPGKKPPEAYFRVNDEAAVEEAK